MILHKRQEVTTSGMNLVGKAGRFAVTNARFAPLHGYLSVPSPLSTTPVPRRKSQARHERRLFDIKRKPAGFRLGLGTRRCASASLFYALLSAFAPLPASRPHREAEISKKHFVNYCERLRTINLMRFKPQNCQHCQSLARIRRQSDNCRAR
jgi:hypothetical protein